MLTRVAGGAVHAKMFVRLNGNYGKKIDAMLKIKRPYETDGLIFTKGGDPYAKTKNFKWKPLDKMTVDFMAKKCPKTLLNIAPYIPKKGMTLYFLFSFIDSRRFESLNLTYVKKYREMFPDPDFRYFPIQFSPSSDPFAYLFWDKRELDGKIVEVGYQTKTRTWKYYRTREDKTKPNDFRIAELTFQNYFNPLTLDAIKSKIDKGYFQEDDNKDFQEIRHFNSFVKSRILAPYADTPWVIDMAGGKGQDIFRYAKLKIKNLVYLEVDKDGISEIIKRKHELRDSSTLVHTIEMDLTHPNKTNIKKIEAIGIHMKERIPLIVCNFAIHYLIGSMKSTQNLIEFIDYYLAPGGKFIFTAFDGRTVFDLLAANRGKWEVRNGEVVKYSIKKDYKSKQMTPTKQKIKVMLPFSKGEYYSEYLVNNTYLEKMFKKVNMARESFDSFATFLQEYASDSPKKFAKLTADDKQFVSLYHFVSYFKSRN